MIKESKVLLYTIVSNMVSKEESVFPHNLPLEFSNCKFIKKVSFLPFKISKIFFQKIVTFKILNLLFFFFSFKISKFWIKRNKTKFLPVIRFFIRTNYIRSFSDFKTCIFLRNCTKIFKKTENKNIFKKHLNAFSFPITSWICFSWLEVLFNEERCLIIFDIYCIWWSLLILYWFAEDSLLKRACLELFLCLFVFRNIKFAFHILPSNFFTFSKAKIFSLPVECFTIIPTLNTCVSIQNMDWRQFI